MDIYSKRRRARELNDDDAPDPVEKGDGDDEVDPDDLELDYGGVVEKANDEEEKREQRKEFAKSLGSGDGIDFEKVFKQDDGDDPALEYSYSGILKSEEERDREKDAEAFGEAVAEKLERRGLGDVEDGETEKDANEDADHSSTDPVEKAERTIDLVGDVRSDLVGLKRQRAVKKLKEDYLSDGGDPDDSLAEVLSWYSSDSGATVKVENGSVELVEEPA